MEALRVLIVEDEPVIAMLLAQVLADMGHQVCDSVATEVEAVAAAARSAPEIMIVDAHLRRGSGVSAVTTILQAGFIPHVFVSGDLLDREGLDPRAIVIRKPFRDSELAAAMNRALGHAAVPAMTRPQP